MISWRSWLLLLVKGKKKKKSLKKEEVVIAEIVYVCISEKETVVQIIIY